MEKMPKNAKICVCKDCDFMCCKQSNYDKHLLTAKHKNRTFLNDLEQKMPENADRLFECECGKRYTARNSLWYHKKKCKIEEFVENIDEPDNIVSDESTNKDQLILMLIKQNSELIKETSEFKNMMMEVIKNGTHNTTTNSHNKAFNLNFFLNETCKDAMNITEFVESIKLQLSDLEKVGELGYVEGISNIIVKNLKNLDITQRPVHCTDQKRETMYIKDQDKWEKDEEQKKMHKLVRKVADKNARMLPKFKEAHPDCIKSTSVYSDQYNKLIIEAMGGRGDNDFEKEEKIIKRVSKEVIVEKDAL
jgi:hypothetical protein